MGDLPDVILNVAAGTCGPLSPAVSEQIDDLVIFVSLVPIDGVGRILGAAGPCFIRISNGLSILGAMRLDTDDLDALEAQGLLGDVILHEMGHVLGFGSLWQTKSLLADPSLDGGADPHFTGPKAFLAFDGVGGTTYSGGEKVPVENTGGGGAADAHWREVTFTNELMRATR